MKKLILAAATSLAMAASAGTANASSVTFVFQNPGADMPTGNFTTGGQCNGINISGSDLCTIDNNAGLTYSKDGISLTAVAFNGSGVTALMQDLAPSNSGLAILSPGESSSDDQIQLSNNEAVEFTFGSSVFLDAIDFNAGSDRNCATPGREGPCGTFDLFVDGILFGSYNALDNMVLGGIVGTVFRVTATGPLDGGFAIGSLSVSEVPVPGAAILLVSGLAGLGLGRRRKTA